MLHTRPLLYTLIATFSCLPLSGEIEIKKEDGHYAFIDSSGQMLLAYQFATYPAPEGEDPAYARSGFIHPLNTTTGSRLTQIQPEDHYHHYGIWNPWTHTEFRGEIVDFWNLAKKQGAVRFSKVLDRQSNSLQVEHEHVVYSEDAPETVALVEKQRMTVTETPAPDRYILDIVSELSCATDEPLTILEYRYGGFTWRPTENWNGENSWIVTSKGKSREEAEGSTARWMIAQGDVDGENAGIALLSHPDNYNHPEPLRIWPAQDKNQGQHMINISPTKTRDWKLEPGETYTLRYRLVVFAGEYSTAEADSAWQDFADRN